MKIHTNYRRNSVDNICQSLSIKKSSLVVNIGQNIFTLLENNSRDKNIKRIPAEVYDLITKCLGDDDNVNDEISVVFKDCC